MINKKKEEKIIETTRRILQLVYSDLNNVELPISMWKIADMLDIDIEEVEFNNPNIIGELDIEKDNDHEVTIKIKKDDIITRKRFTIAHEIGHYILEKGLGNTQNRTISNFPIKSQTVMDQEYNIINADYSEEQEQAANIFAANLLMPKELVKKYWRTKKNIEFIATMFLVSRSGAHWRLYNLNLIDIPPQ